MTQTASEAAHQHETELQETVGQGSDVHQVGGEDEERDSKQDIAVEQAIQNLLGRSPEIETRKQEIKHRGHDHRMPDRQAERAEGYDCDDAKRERRERHGDRSDLRVGVGCSAPNDSYDQPAIADDAGGEEDDVDRVQPVQRHVQIGRALDLHEAHV